MDELKDDLQSKIADYSKMAESGKNEQQFFSFFPYSTCTGRPMNQSLPDPFVFCCA